MLKAPWWSFVVMLGLLPPLVVAIFMLHKSFCNRLTFFLVGGLLLNQWMHVWCYRLQNRFAQVPETRLHSLFLWQIDWTTSLALGVLLGIAVYFSLILGWHPEKVGFNYVAYICIAIIVASQIAASSIPKFALDVALIGLYLLGLVAWKYFLTYHPGSIVTTAQIQSDTLTSFGLIISFLALWLPAAISFGSFLFQYYQSQKDVGIQFQMTRYAAGVSYMLLGFGLVIYKIIEILVAARNGVAEM